MKKIVFILLVVFAVSGCDYTQDLYFLMKIGYGFELYYHEDFEDLNSFEDIANYIDINNNIMYKSDSVDTWQSPRKTISTKTGDCDDIAILFVNIAYVSLGLEMDIVVNNTHNRTVVNGGKVNHAEAHYDGIVYDPYTGLQIGKVKIGFLYTAKELFNL